jgi:hypothetical protein
MIPAVAWDLYVWQAPRDLDDEQAADLLDAWTEAGEDPAASPFEASTDVGWFHRELLKDVPGVHVLSDAVPSRSSTPIWLSATDEPPARLVAVRLARDTALDVVESVVGLAAKYDLVVFNARTRRMHRPLDEIGAQASATFWPAGAIRAAVAGLVGALVAAPASFAGIPAVSGIVIVVGAFLALAAIYTFVHEGRAWMLRRGPQRDDEEPSERG